ncbi:methyltransferase domain-containing protein [Pseudodesulfovibrio sp. JC047]|uniref:50S ribosomal protein L11 methyltransferase n=1 Tax=Pseudodesulfovibrio sp. JC047 TaxID=2683199 RepID=UPI0013CF97FC|nr:50S ribosomal protein L11 methyltransferase [Pseudodesulfovibrio sp. JC047]NDV19160.1 methyltransferase domain-containing protein [Pseudodesulfovibrio sp. JC047]
MSTLLKVALTVTEEQADEAEGFISTKISQGWEESTTEAGHRMTLYLEDHSLGRQVAQEFQTQFPEATVACSEEESQNWVDTWKEFFTPVVCGDTFKIFPPWLSEKEQNGVTHIVIEPKMAFGTGHHPTTSLCLGTIGTLAKKKMIHPGQTFLDLGTGSGILSIGLAKAGLTGLGLDYDPLAIPCAIENLENNDVADAVEMAVGTLDCLDEKRQFDLIVANILSGPLIDMAPNILPHIAPGGTLILSGILAEKQSDAVSEVYDRRGIGLPTRFVDGEWVCLVWKNITR